METKETVTHNQNICWNEKASADSGASFFVLDLATGHPISSETLPPCVVALGNFDGVHLAHRTLLQETVRLARMLSLQHRRENSVEPAAFFFDPPSGDYLISPAPGHLTTRQEKLSIFRNLGIRYAIIARFPALRHQPADDFISFTLRQGCHAVGAVCGYNFRFGAMGSGSAETLKQGMAPCPVRCLSPIFLPGHSNPDTPPLGISSSRIRQIVMSADMDLARKMLGEPYRLTGTVVHGKQLGRTIGIPTLNQNVPKEKMLPPCGIYATRCQIAGKVYDGVTNIGTRPTTDTSGSPCVNIETHLLHAEGDFYGQTATVYFYRFLREEKTFSSLEDLRHAIEADTAHAVEILAEIPLSPGNE